jgi:hypothetical protein
MPDCANPDPVIDTPLIVTALEPVAVMVSDWVTVVFKLTLPNAMLVEFTVRLEVAAFNCSEKVLDELPVVAVKVAVCAVLTAETVALKLALVEPEGTVTDAGTTTELLLLAMLITWPPLGAAPLRVAVQLSVEAPVIELDAQVRALIVGAGTGFNCRAKDCDEEPVVAVRVAV